MRQQIAIWRITIGQRAWEEPEQANSDTKHRGRANERIGSKEDGRVYGTVRVHRLCGALCLYFGGTSRSHGGVQTHLRRVRVGGWGQAGASANCCRVTSARILVLLLRLSCRACAHTSLNDHAKLTHQAAPAGDQDSNTAVCV